jgi:peptidoglycan/LPS O-acetylase OafA/YrhL
MLAEQVNLGPQPIFETPTRPLSAVHCPALNGLRGVAILMVLAVHLVYGNFIPYQASPAIRLIRAVMWSGWTGVDLFFVLSGFLITGILLDTKSKASRALSFYARRALRIFPLYYAALLAGIAASVFFPAGWAGIKPKPQGTQAWGAYALYAQNWYLPSHPKSWELFQHFWSLAVEEQFYLIWPCIVWLAPRRRLLFICGAGTLGPFVCRLVWLHFDSSSTAVLMNTLTRCDTLLCGAFCAIAVRDPEILFRLRRKLPWIAGISLSGIGAVDFGARELWMRGYYTQLFGFTFFALLYGCVLLWAYLQPRGSILSRILTLPPLIKFGKSSYGIYVYHPFVLVAGTLLLRTRHGGPITILICITMVGISYSVAALSYHMYEEKFLALKSKFVAR